MAVVFFEQYDRFPVLAFETVVDLLDFFFDLGVELLVFGDQRTARAASSTNVNRC